jgi:hypothetical protein
MTGKTMPTPTERRGMITETANFMTHGRGLTTVEPASARIDGFRTVDLSAQVLERLTTRVAMTTQKLRALKGRVSTLAVSARAALDSDVEKLDALNLSLRSKLDALRTRRDKVSEKALHQAENEWNELSDSLQYVTAMAQRQMGR